MSHATIMVITKDPFFDENKIDELMYPYYELECGLNEEEIQHDSRAVFVQESTLEQAKKDWEDKKNSDYWKEKDFEYKDVYEYMKEFCGYDWYPDKEAFGRFTNPNRRWDWYKIGGRWQGLLKVREDADEDTLAEGSPGVMGCRHKNEGVDSALVKDITNLEDIGTFAVLTEDGKWLEKGKMGWFGCRGESDSNKFPFPEKFKATYINHIWIDNEWYNEKYKNKIKNLTYKYYDEVDGYFVLKEGMEFGEDIKEEDTFQGLAWDASFYEAFIKDLTPEHRITIVDYHI